MNRRLATPATIFALAAALSGAPAQERGGRAEGGALLLPGARIGIVVVDGTGGSHVDRVVGDMLAGALRRAGVRVIERQAIEALAKEQALVRGGVVDPATAAPAGRVLGVDCLLAVKATEFGVKDDRIGGAVALGPVAGIQVRTSTARVVLDARLIDTATGTILDATTAEGKQVQHGGTLLGGVISGRVINLGGIDIGSKEWSESSLGKAARKAVDALASRLAGPLSAGEGTVLAALPNGDAVVSLGSGDGVRPGDEVSVLRLESLRNSSGQIVWTDERLIGRLRVVEVRADRAKARPVGVLEGVREGDRVRLIRGPRSADFDRRGFQDIE